MRGIRTLAIGTLALLGPWTAVAEAGWAVGVRIGGPCCYRPWGYYPYYRPYPIVVAPAVVVNPVPVAQPVPVYAVPAAPVPEQAPAPTPLPPPTPVTSQTSPGELPLAPVPVQVQTVSSTQRQDDITMHLQRLANPDERVRAESAVLLGRMKAHRAVDPLAATLAGDQSPLAREAAARALGLIGDARAMPALRRAAQADGDATVRSTATFALDVIQSRR